MKFGTLFIAFLLIGNTLKGHIMQYFEGGLPNPATGSYRPSNPDLPPAIDAGIDKPIAAFLPASPSPADKEVLLSWELKRTAEVTLSFNDEQRRLTVIMPLGVQRAGIWTKAVETTALSEGIYYVTLYADKQQIVQKFVVQH